MVLIVLITAFIGVAESPAFAQPDSDQLLQRQFVAELLARYYRSGYTANSNSPVAPYPSYPFASGPSNTSFSPNQNVYPGNCAAVKVDCGTHRISIIPMKMADADSVIDCGAMGLTKNGVGRVGGPHNGPVVHDGVEIEIPGMGASGGGKVFHTCFWRPNPTPLGQDTSQGCVHTSPAVLDTLKHCKGSPLEIVNARGGGEIPQTSQLFSPEVFEENGVNR